MSAPSILSGTATRASKAQCTMSWVFIAGSGHFGSPASYFLRMCYDDSWPSPMENNPESICQNLTIATTFYSSPRSDGRHCLQGKRWWSVQLYPTWGLSSSQVGRISWDGVKCGIFFFFFNNQRTWKHAVVCVTLWALGPLVCMKQGGCTMWPTPVSPHSSEARGVWNLQTSHATLEISVPEAWDELGN
jgi:hypothetical protein